MRLRENRSNAGYVARKDSHHLFFKYDETKFKGYEEPIAIGSAEDEARLKPAKRESKPTPKAAAAKAKPAASRRRRRIRRRAARLAALDEGR